MRSFFVAATTLVSLFAATSAQSIDPDSVPISTRSSWCTSQVSQCPLICTQENDGSAATEVNTCDPATLNYACVCGNGLTPNASEYSQTIPYYTCTQFNTNCQNNCGGSSSCQAACVQNHPCGAQNPTRVNTSAITTTMSSTSTGAGAAKTTASDGVVYSGFGGSTQTASSSNGNTQGSGAARALAAGELYGLGVVAAGIFAGFALFI